MIKKLVCAIAAFTTSFVCSADFSQNLLSDELERPWAVTVLPDQSLLVTEREGQLRWWHNGKLSSPIAVPAEIFNSGQGGLLDVHPHPNFANNHTIYLTYATGSRNKNATRLAKAQFKQGKLSGFTVLFTAKPLKKAAYHFSGRMAFLPDQTLVFGVGDGYNYMEQAQTLDSHFGKILRLNDDGTVPADNPFVGKKDAMPEIYSYGHRNPQGMYFDKKTQQLISNEHGPKGGDEINLIEAGENYGWPAITYGVAYSGKTISEHTHMEGMLQPLVQWTPSIAPSSVHFYRHKTIPEFQDSLLNTALKFEELRSVKVTSTRKGNWQVGEQQTHLKEEIGRIRDLDVNANGEVLLVTDSGKLVKLTAKK